MLRLLVLVKFKSIIIVNTGRINFSYEPVNL